MGVIADLVKGHVGEIHPGRAADLGFAVDLIHVFARFFTDPLMGQLEEILAFAKGHDFLGAGFDACRRPAELEAGVVAHDALFYYRIKGVGIAVGRNIERTGHHAGPAADAHGLVIDYRAFRRFFVGIDKTGGQTGGLVAMVALHLPEKGMFAARHVILLHYGVSLFRCPSRQSSLALLCKYRHIVKWFIRRRQPLLFVAGGFAGSAADTFGKIDKHAHAVRVADKSMRSGHCLFACPDGGDGSATGQPAFQETSAV